MSSFAERLDYGLEPLRTAWLLTLLLVRLVFSVALGIAMGVAVARGLICPLLPGAIVLAIGAGMVAFWMMMGAWFSDRGLSWLLSGALRVALLVLFLAAMAGARLGLEYVAFERYPHLEFLHDYPLLWRVPVAFFAGLLTALTVERLVLGPPRTAMYDGPNSDETVKRGVRFVPTEWVRSFYRRACAGEPYVNFLWAPIPIRLARMGGILLTGSPGVGKSVALQSTIFGQCDQAVREPGGTFTAVVTDVGNEFYPILRERYARTGLPLFHILPFHRPALALDIGSLPKSMMSQVAMALHPQPPASANGTDMFFYRTLVGLTTAGLNGFKVKYGAEFSLAMFATKMATREGMLEAISWDADNVTNVTAVNTYLKSSDPRLSGNVEATFAAAASQFQAVFAGMHHQWAAGQRFSFEQLEQGGVCVIGWDSNHNTEMAAWHGLLFRLLKWRVLSRPESTSRHLLVVLDELATFVGPIASSAEKELEALMREGRKRGAVVCLAAATRNSVASAVGSTEAADAILGLPKLYGAFQTGDPDHALWSARRLSGEGSEVERKVVTTTTSTTQPNGPPQKSEYVLRETKMLVTPGQLLGRKETPDADAAGEDILAFGTTHWGDVFPVRYPFSALKRDYPRPQQPFVLAPFGEKELELRIEPTPSPKQDEAVGRNGDEGLEPEVLAELHRLAQAELEGSAREEAPPARTPRRRRRRRAAPEATLADGDGLSYEE